MIASALQQEGYKPPSRPSFGTAARFWLKLGFISFGGPAGQIAIMHEEVVERKKWVTEEQFLHALNYCMLLPGPEAQQLATYLGWLLHRTWGGILAGAFFILPSTLILWALSWAFVAFGEISWVSSLFHGLQPAVLAIVAAAVLRLGERTLKTSLLWGIAILSFAALFLANASFIVLIGLAGALGWTAGKWKPRLLFIKRSEKAPASTNPPAPPTVWRGLRVILTSLTLWWIPILAVGLVLGFGSLIFQQGLFFSKVALVTFGGAYAVLPYVAQRAVTDFHWLNTSQMMTGLGLAETTPGPLIMVLQFVGFVAAWQNPGNLPPLAAATLGAAVTTWATFLPSFLFVFLGAPYIERLRNIPSLNGALAGISAAVAGVMLNLALWFGLHMARPDSGSWNYGALIAAVILFLLIRLRKWPATWIIALGAAYGLISWILFGGAIRR